MATNKSRPGPEHDPVEFLRQILRRPGPIAKDDPVMKRIRARRERIRKRVGLLDDSTELIREDRDSR